MAIKVNQIGGSPVAAPFKDSRAEGYVTYYTKAGWDRWKLSADQVAQLVAEQKLEYQKAMDIYKQQLKDIDTRKAGLEKRISDIQLKQAGYAAQQEMLVRRAQQEAALATGKAEQERAKQGAYHPSWSYSIGWSRSLGTGAGGAFNAAGGRDVLEELMDGVGSDHGTSAHQGVTEAVNASDTYENAARAMQAQYNRMKAGQLTGDQYGSGIQLYAAHRAAAAKLAQETGMSEEAAGREIDNALKSMPDGSVIAGAIDYGEKAVMDRANGYSKGPSESQHEGKSGGSYYGDYNVPAIPIADQKIDTSAFDATLEDTKKKLANLGTESDNIIVPVIEPIDLIATARKTYMEKFGDVPRGVTLNFGNGTYGQYKNLLPYELTDAVKKTNSFFAMYIDDAVRKARSAALEAGKPFTIDDLNAATEAGKAAARLVLFGGVVAADKKAEAETGTPAPPNPIEKAKADMAAVRSSGILGPEGDAIFAELEASAPPSVGTLTPPSGRTPGVNVSEALRGREGLPPVIEAAPVPSPSIIPVPPPELGTKPEMVETPEEKKRRTIGDILLRGFKPELDRETGMPIIPTLTGPERAQAIAGVARQGYNQAELFPESMHPPYPRSVEGTSFRPMTATEFPKLPMNKLDRAALGLDIPVGTPVTGNLPPSYYNAPLTEEERAKIAAEARDRAIAGRSGLLSPSAAPIFKKIESSPVPSAEGLKAPSGKTPGVNMGDFFKNRQPPKTETAPVPTPKVDVLGQADKKAKTEAVVAATNAVMENPKVAAKAIVKDNMGKYVASLYDENKVKGASAQSIGDLTSTVIREYSGDPVKQKKAVELLTQLALLDGSSNQIRPA